MLWRDYLNPADIVVPPLSNLDYTNYLTCYLFKSFTKLLLMTVLAVLWKMTKEKTSRAYSLSYIIMIARLASAILDLSGPGYSPFP